MSDLEDFMIKDGILTGYSGCGGDVIIPSCVKKIGDWAFRDNERITSITIPDGVAEIGYHAFGGCVNLASVILPHTLTKMLPGAFVSCVSLTTIEIPPLIKLIPKELFAYCGNLREVKLPVGISEIGWDAFCDCASLERIDVPEEVKTIGVGAFARCSNLSEVVIQNEDFDLGPSSYIFSYCTNLRTLTIPESMLINCDNSIHHRLGLSGKAVQLNIRQKNGNIQSVIAAFRQDVCKRWSYDKNYLLPTASKDLPIYDRLLALGEFDGFKMTIPWRVRAILCRLQDSAHPFDDDCAELIKEFLAKNITKVVKVAEEENSVSYIELANKFCAFSGKEQKKLMKHLLASGNSELQQIAEKVNEEAANSIPIPPVEKPTSGVESKYIDRLAKLNAKTVLMKWASVQLPDVQLKNQKGTAPKEYLQLILAEYITSDGKYIGAPAELAEEVAGKLDAASLCEALLALFNKVKSDQAKKSMLAVLFRFADGQTVKKLYTLYQSDYYSRDCADLALLLSDTREAMLLAEKHGLIDAYANARNTDADTLRDTALAELGLDAKGQKVFDLGKKRVIASLSPELNISLWDEDAQKAVNALPKRGSDPGKYETAKDALSELKKNVKKVAKSRCDRLFREFIHNVSTPASKWKQGYMNNYLLQQIASLLVWTQGGNSFTIKDGSAVTNDETPYAIGDLPIGIAHPMELSRADVLAWQNYYIMNRIKQPFIQIWEPVVDFKSVRKDRYRGIEIPAYRFKGQEKHGIHFEFSFGASELRIDLEECNLTYDDSAAVGRHTLDIQGKLVLGDFSFGGQSRQVNHIISLLDNWTIVGWIMRDDPAIVTKLDDATLAQITQYLNIAIENKKIAVTAALMDYKTQRFPEYNPLDEFSLEGF